MEEKFSKIMKLAKRSYLQSAQKGDKKQCCGLGIDEMSLYVGGMDKLVCPWIGEDVTPPPSPRDRVRGFPKKKLRNGRRNY